MVLLNTDWNKVTE